VRNALFHQILHIGLDYPVPTRPLNPDNDPDIHLKQKLYDLYETGQISISQYHHMQDREYEEINGLRQRRRLEEMTEDEMEVIDSFVEDTPGEREVKLRQQVEGGVGAFDQFDDKGIKGESGEAVMLHPMDRRAVEFRERMRTW